MSYACKLCGTFQAGLEEKIRLHLEQHLNGDFRCKICKIELDYPGNRRQHNEECHPKKWSKARNSKICEVCGKEFWKASSWKEHGYKCHGVMSFSCSVCFEKFALKRTYNYI